MKSGGVSSHIDDAVLQSKFIDWIHPTPRFQYYPYEYNKKQIAIIRIPPNPDTGPCVPLKDVPSGEHQVMRQHTLYIRRNSVNDLANLDDQKKVYAWFRREQQAGLVPEGGSWDALLDEMGHFSSDYYYGLIVDNLGADPDLVTPALGLIDWSFVIDFDRETDIQGDCVLSRYLNRTFDR